MLSRLRALVKEADPKSSRSGSGEAFGVSHDGLICTGETYKNVVKMTFAKGRSEGSIGLFNSSLEGNTSVHRFPRRRTIDEEALRTLIRSAVTLNKSRAAG